MSPHQTIAVTVRLFAVWLAVHAARQILSVYYEGTNHNDSNVVVVALSASMLMVVLILALWFFPVTIARKLLSSPARESASPAPPDIWLAMGCALIGLWVLATSLPALVRDVLILHFSGAALEDTTNLNLSLLYYSVEIAIAIWLILGAKGFREIFWWVQHAGYNPSDH